MPSGICAPAGQRRRRRIRRIYTPLQYYTTTTQPLHFYVLYTYTLCRELACIETESINRKRIRKKAPTGQQSLSRHRRRRRQSPCQQAQVMINVLERSSSRSLLVRVLSGGCCPTLSSGRNVLGILAQPSPSPLVVPASITDSKRIKVSLYLSPFFPYLYIFCCWWEREERDFILLYYRRINPIRQVKRDFSAAKIRHAYTRSGNANGFLHVQYNRYSICNVTLEAALSVVPNTINLNKSKLNSNAILVNTAQHLD